MPAGDQPVVSLYLQPHGELGLFTISHRQQVDQNTAIDGTQSPDFFRDQIHLGPKGKPLRTEFSDEESRRGCSPCVDGCYEFLYLSLDITDGGFGPLGSAGADAHAEYQEECSHFRVSTAI